MLHISDQEFKQDIDTDRLQAFQKIKKLPAANAMFTRWLLFVFGMLFILLFLPWTQNIQAKGKVTALRPDQRPQTIHATIAGRIEQWYVQEGQLIRKGDTIVHLTETKTDYFDPDLAPRTAAQVDAKQNAITSYESKAGALENQIQATKSELDYKKNQLRNKVKQSILKVEADQNDLQAAGIDYETEAKQLKRAEELYAKGLRSLTELENKRLKLQQAQAKKISAETKYQTSLNEVENARLQLSALEQEYAGKIAKSESEKYSTLSDKFAAVESINKLRNQYANYSRRSDFYYITAPQDCYITKAMVPGIGETVKEGEPIVSIVPAQYELAVELYIEPIDLPLIHKGSQVRFVFDGWPAFFFSGWPDQSFGTYSGKVVAMDNMISEQGRYRILVGPDPEEAPWPGALRPGSGAHGIALLGNVPVWYELWRQLNSFPPDFYKTYSSSESKKK